MSHLLTRLADRALGTASTVEPVRSLVFTGETAGYGEPMEPGASVRAGVQHDAPGFAYGDIVRTLQASPTQTPGATGGLSDAVSAPDVNGPFVPIAHGQQQGHDVTASSSLVEARIDGAANKLDAQPALTETELTGVRGGPRATALSPVTSRSSYAINSHSSAHPLADEQGSDAVDVPAEWQTSSDPLAQTSPDSLLRPRASPAPSFPVQQVAIENRPLERNESHLPQPTIQVTIGRIDVRAVTAPSPPAVPRARKKPSPSLSLDDYLKQRAGGQR